MQTIHVATLVAALVSLSFAPPLLAIALPRLLASVAARSDPRDRLKRRASAAEAAPGAWR